MATELELAYEHCQRVARSQAKNFYYGFRTLPVRQRRSIYAAYAFCRICDDIADGSNPLEEKRRLLAGTRQSLLRSKNDAVSDPMFAALADTLSTFDIPARYFEEVIEGVEMDLVHTSYKSYEDLSEYCYKVASAVGLICIEISGYEDSIAKEYVVDLGFAMQLTNILRDLKEDAQRGRIYVPLDEIASFGYSPEELRAGVINDAFRALMKHQIARARRYFDSGRRLLPLVPARASACPAILIAVYSSILDRIESSDFDVFTKRVGLGAIEKLLMMARLWATSLIPVYPGGK